MNHKFLTIAKVLSIPGKMDGNEERYNCPFCDDTKYHLYYNPSRNLYNCFKCETSGYFKRARAAAGTTTMVEPVVEEVERIPRTAIIVDVKTAPLPVTSFLFSKGVPHEILPTFRYETRPTYYALYVPVYFQGEYVGFQVRYIQGNQGIKPAVKYLSAKGFKKSQALFNYDNIKDSNRCAVVEGIFDCFRLPNAVAIFGKSVSDFQAHCIASTFNEVLIALDKDCSWQEHWGTCRKFIELGLDVSLLRYDASDYNSPGDFSSIKESMLLKVVPALDVQLFPGYDYEAGFHGESIINTKWWRKV